MPDAQATDRATVDAVLRLDPALDHAQACGAAPLAGALLAARVHGLAPPAGLRNSGDTAGDRARGRLRGRGLRAQRCVG
jgi:hypothetical protein